MKANKNTLLFVLSGVLVIALFIILGVLAATKNPVKNTTALQIANNTSAIDSVKSQFAKTVDKLDAKLETSLTNKDSVLNIGEKDLQEYAALKNEIATLLKDSTGTADIELAKKKITILEYKIEELKFRNTSIEADNKRLNAIIVQLLQKDRVVANTPLSTTNSSRNLPTVNEPQSTTGMQFGNINLATLTDENNNTETNVASSVKKINGSFTVKGGTNSANTEVMIVLQQPNGKVIKNSDWESGLFQTKEGFRKIYSMIVRFDYAKGTNKQCDFAINTEDLPSGKYLLQLYHKGTLIGQANKTLR